MRIRRLKTLRGHRNKQRGLSMIEVLVTLVILAFGILGLAGLQMAAFKFNKEASTRSLATGLAGELSDRMRSNMAGVKAGNYARNLDYATALSTAVSAPSCGSPAHATDCTAANLALLDLSDWLSAISSALPQGTGALVPVTGNASTSIIVVMWKEKSLNDSGSTDTNCPTTPLATGVRCFTTTFMP